MTVVDLTVVICAYTNDRWDLLRRAVASVESQSRPEHHSGSQSGSSRVVGDVQIVVVIDHEPDLLERSREHWPQHTVIANSEKRGLSGARNSGVRMATGEIVAFLDDDAAAEPHWLEHLSRHFADPDVWGVGGYVEPDFLDGHPGWLPDEFGWVVGCSYRGQPTIVGEVRNPIGANMAFRRSALMAAGRFRDGMGRIGKVPLGCEETELSIRVRELGGRVVFDPDARVIHAVPRERTAWRYFLRRCWAEGLSKAAVVDVAGSDAGLSSERSYVSRVLPSALWESVHHMVVGPRRGMATAQGAAIIAGSLVTATGFARGRMSGLALGGVR